MPRCSSSFWSSARCSARDVIGRAAAFFAAASVALALPAIAVAQGRVCDDGAVGCHQEPIAFADDGCSDFLGVALDSGWLPDADAPIQVRFRVVIGGLAGMDMGMPAAAHVELDGFLSTFWPEPLTVLATGRRGGGRLTVGYGLEVQVQVRLDLDIEGIRIRDTFDIPVPGDLDRFRADGTTTFEPWAFAPMIAEARGESARFTVFEYDVLGPFFDFDLPFGIDVDVGGGFRLDMAAYIEGSYETEQVDLAGVFPPATAEVPRWTVSATDPSGDYGAAQDLTVQPRGWVACELGITFYPTLFIDIGNFELEYVLPVDLDIGLDRDRSTLDFEPASVHVPLPDIAVTPELLDLGTVALPARGLIDIRNEGEAELVVEASGSGPEVGLSPPTLRIAPGATQTLTIALTASAADPAATYVLLRSNDPDRPEIAVGLLGTAATPPPAMPDGGLPSGPDGGVVPGSDGGATTSDAMPPASDGGRDARTDLDGGCGCRVAGPAPRSSIAVAMLLLGVALAMARRRRRERIR